MKFLSRLLLLWLVVPGLAAAEGYPSITLRKDGIEMKIYLPDPADGYYRGARFDWSGMIAGVQWEGHQFFGEWREGHDPAGSDHVLGPAEEFGMEQPPGYADAAVGGTFLKIGIGILRKPAEAKYWFPNPYEIVEAAPWKISHDDTSITFQQRAQTGAGYGYAYEKTVRLMADPPGFVIEHRLKNSGTKPWVTDTYCHNFVVLDGKPLGPHLTVTVPFKMPEANLKGIADIGGETIRFVGGLAPGKSLYAPLAGLAGNPSDNAATFTDRDTGASLAFRGDQPPAKMVFYAIGRAVCVEPFLKLDLTPGKDLAWQTRYVLRVLLPTKTTVR